MSRVPSPSGDASPATTLRISTALISSDQFELIANVLCSPAPQVKSASAAALDAAGLPFASHGSHSSIAQRVCSAVIVVVASVVVVVVVLVVVLGLFIQGLVPMMLLK